MTRPRWALALIGVATGLMFWASKTMQVQVVERGGETTWAYGSIWAMLMGAAAACLLVAGALFAAARIGWARVICVLPFMLGGLIGVAAYDAAIEHLTITPTGLVVPGRGLLPPPYERLAFDEMGGVMVDWDERIVTFYRKDRRQVTVPVGDLMRAAMPRVREALEAHGVSVAED